MPLRVGARRRETSEKRAGRRPHGLRRGATAEPGSWGCNGQRRAHLECKERKKGEHESGGPSPTSVSRRNPWS